MKITLKKDVLLADSSLGHKGESHVVSKELGLHMVREGFAEAAEAGEAEAAEEANPKPKKTKLGSHTTAPVAEAGTVETVGIGTIETK